MRAMMLTIIGAIGVLSGCGPQVVGEKDWYVEATGGDRENPSQCGGNGGNSVVPGTGGAGVPASGGSPTGPGTGGVSAGATGGAQTSGTGGARSIYCPASLDVSRGDRLTIEVCSPGFAACHLAKGGIVTELPAGCVILGITCSGGGCG